MSETNEQILARWKGYLERDLVAAINDRDNAERRIERLKDGLKTFDKLIQPKPTTEGSET